MVFTQMTRISTGMAMCTSRTAAMPSITATTEHGIYGALEALTITRVVMGRTHQIHGARPDVCVDALVQVGPQPCSFV